MVSFEVDGSPNGTPLEKDALYVVTSDTEVFTFSQAVHLIILIDVSASMLTIGAVGKPKSLFSVAFER